MRIGWRRRGSLRCHRVNVRQTFTAPHDLIWVAWCEDCDWFQTRAQIQATQADAYEHMRYPERP